MNKDIPNLFDKLSLRFWYKYLLYFAGVLLVLVVVVGSKIDTAQVISFSLWTIVLSVFLWILDDLFRYADIDEMHTNALVGVRGFVHFIVFLIWAVIAFKSFF